MTLVAGHFTKPQGLVEPRSMFPGETDDNIRTRLETYIAEGIARTSTLDADLIDSAVTAWVYYRAFFAVYVELSGTPSSNAMADQGSTLYTSYQIENFRALSNQFLAEFTGYAEAAAPKLLRSYSVHHTIAYD